VLPECFAAEQRGVVKRRHRVSHVGLFDIKVGRLVDLTAVVLCAAWH
jgi:hypothetical protein